MEKDKGRFQKKSMEYAVGKFGLKIPFLNEEMNIYPFLEGFLSLNKNFI